MKRRKEKKERKEKQEGPHHTPGWPLGAPDSLCTILLASPSGAGGCKRGRGGGRTRGMLLLATPIRAGGCRRGAGPDPGKRRPRDFFGCVRCLVDPVLTLGAPDSLCTVFLASPIGGCKRGGGPDPGWKELRDPSGYQNHAVCGAWCVLVIQNAMCEMLGGSWVTLGRSRLAVHRTFVGLSYWGWGCNLMREVPRSPWVSQHGCAQCVWPPGFCFFHAATSSYAEYSGRII